MSIIEKGEHTLKQCGAQEKNYRISSSQPFLELFRSKLTNRA